MIIICTRQSGVFRAGVFHPHGKKVWPDDYFNQEQIQLILQEPLLEVVDREVEKVASCKDAVDIAMKAMSAFLNAGQVKELELFITNLLPEQPAKKRRRRKAVTAPGADDPVDSNVDTEDSEQSADTDTEEGKQE